MEISGYGKLTLILLSISVIVAASSVFSSPFFAIISFVMFIFYVVEIYRADKFYVVALSPLLFFWITELFSGIFIEFGAMMVETRNIGEATGGFSRLSLIYAVIFSAGFLCWRSLFPRLASLIRSAENNRAGLPGEGIFLFGVLALVMFFFLVGVTRGFPLLLGSDRFSYRAGFGSKALVSFLDNRIIIFSIIGACFAFGRHRALSIFLFIFTIIVSVLYGEKFTSIVQAFIFFSIPYALFRLARVGSLPLAKALYVFIAMIFITVPAILINYGVLQEGGGEAYTRLFNRAALQGQLWYLADKNYSQMLNFDYQSISAAVKSIFNIYVQAPSMAPDHGMYYVMRPFTDSWTMYWVQYAQGGFVFAHMPYWLMVSGFTGALTVGVCTILFTVWVCINANIALFSKDIIESAIWFKIIIWIYAGYTMGDIWFFFGVKSLVLIVVALSWRRIVSGRQFEYKPDVVRRDQGFP